MTASPRSSTLPTRILVANRGEIARRVQHTARRLGIATVAVFSDADADLPFVQEADQAVRLGPGPARESYLRGDLILAAARATGAEAIHPGYGFLSENAAFAQAVLDAGLMWIGPPPAAIQAMGLKDAAKRLMAAAGVPVVPGYQGDDQDPTTLATAAAEIGYPVLIKAVAGGGGKGMRRVDQAGDFAAALEGARREAANSFGDDRVLVEKYLTRPRHIEVQVFGDSHGQVVHLFERDCSLQRRHQKVVEEAPAPGMTAGMRAAMGAAAVRAAQAIGYTNAGTIEFIADVSDGLREDRFYFMEMNTRLQVEHPVTEAVTGQDLVEWQIRVAAGQPLPLPQAEIPLDGHAIEVRLYAEDPDQGFLPAPGRLESLRLPPFLEFHGPQDEAAAEDEGAIPGLRVDGGVNLFGDTISSFYDPMIAKIICWGRDREQARTRLHAALKATVVDGIRSNRAFLVNAVGHDAFAAGDVDTGFIARHLEALLAPVAPLESAAELALVAAALLPRLTALDTVPPSPFEALTGFRLWGPAEQPIAVEVNGVAIQGRLALSRDGTLSVSADGVGAGAFQLRASGISQMLRDPESGLTRPVVSSGPFTSATGPAHWVRLSDHREVLVRERLDFAAGLEDLTAETTLRAPLPGVVRAVLVAAGDRVARDQPMVVVEAMKMEHTLRAPVAGAVASLSASIGQMVAEGTVLAEVDRGE